GGPGSGHLGHHLGHSGHSSPNSGHHPDHSGHSGHPGRFSVSVAATSAPAASGRGRRLSCTVALAVAGAMAAVTVASVLVLDLLPGGTRHDNGDSPHSKAPTPANSGGATGAAARVPERYVGTWEGEGTVLDGAVPAGTFRLTVRRVRVGEELGRITQTDHLGASCTDVLTLKQITEKQVVASSAGVGKNGGHCNQDTATVRLSPVGDDLGYVSDSKASGYPEARMTKVE
ncbi:MAG TPA: serine/threonine protein kinase, partial [Streptomyces sp.]|nr:serine/threonine protein kinase [Streptomyces sp.]